MSSVFFIFYQCQRFSIKFQIIWCKLQKHKNYQIDSFGTIDAESGERLFEYFYHAKIIEELLDYKKAILIGRKGSGKTAIGIKSFYWKWEYGSNFELI